MSADDGNQLGQTVDSAPVPELSDTAKCNKRLRLCDSHDGERGLNGTYLEKSTTLTTIPRHKDINRLGHLSKKYLEYFVVSKSRTGKRPQPNIATCINPDPYAWLLEPEWHDWAYKELLFIRKMHSSLLDKVYMDGNGECFKSYMAAEAHRKHLKKLVNFLGKSRDDIDALSKEECYDSMMDIKCVVDYHTKQERDHLQQAVSSEFAGETQVHNWRDHTYERLQSLRNMYSCKLDDAYKYVHGGHAESKLLTMNKNQCLEFLKESLDLLANSRADLVFLSMKKCFKRLKRIECFVEDGNNFSFRRMYLVLRDSTCFSGCQNQEEGSLPNWRDLAYEEIQSMRDGSLLRDYRCGYASWSKIPELHERVEELAECIGKATSFFAVSSRHAMALVSKDEHPRSVWEHTGVLEKLGDLMSRLKKESRQYSVPYPIRSESPCRAS